MLPIAFLEHELPERIRLKVPSRRGDPSFFQAITRDLAQQPAVETLKANPDTGSVVIWHHGDTDAIGAYAAERGIFELRPQPSGGLIPASEADARHGTADMTLLTASAAVLFGLGIYQILRGQHLGSATESFWNAYAAHRLLNSPVLASALLGIGLIQLLRGYVLGPASTLLFYALMLQYSTDGRGRL